jgi:hypothetical protein
MNAYLAVVHAEAEARGYAFDRSKVGPVREVALIPVATGQIDYEWRHLLQKLAIRNPLLYAERRDSIPTCHPLFLPHPGPVASWERAPSGV